MRNVVIGVDEQADYEYETLIQKKLEREKAREKAMERIRFAIGK